MNTTEKIIAVIGASLIFLMGLLPPWKYVDKSTPEYYEIPAGYYFIFSPPLPDEEGVLSLELDLSRIAVQWLTVLFVMAVAIYITHTRNDVPEGNEEMEEPFEG